MRHLKPFDLQTLNMPTSFNMYFNADYARSRGVEAILKSRILKKLVCGFKLLIIALSYRKSSSPLDNLLVQAGQLSEKPLELKII